MTYFAEAEKAKKRTKIKPLPAIPEEYLQKFDLAAFGMTTEPMTISRPETTKQRMDELITKHFQKMKLPEGIKNTVELVRQGRVERAMGR